jgi:hypothetical protein
MTTGINTILDLFHPNVKCSIEEDEFIGSYNLLLNYTNKGIAKFEYHDISYITQSFNNFLIISVYGYIRSIGFYGNISSWNKFNEIIILEYIEQSYMIVNYMIKSMG